MDAGSASGGPSLKQLILVPAVITLGVTLLRLVGELQNWSPTFFNSQAGGPWAIVGIVWLVPIFGLYFGLKLARSGLDPSEPMARTVGFALLGMVVMMAIGTLGVRLAGGTVANIAAFTIGAVAAIPVAFRGWPALGRTLLAYGFAARIPVAIVMLLAILGDWGTHYDSPPPNFPPSSPLLEWLLTGLVPQLTFWISFTLLFGMLVGGLAVALARRRLPATA